MKLSNAIKDSGHNNNFNLLRLLAASCVVISHSCALATGDPSTEPLRASLGISLGSLAVAIFFIMSGFLVTHSLLQNNNPVKFVISRATRIYPALFITIAITILAIGPTFTQSSTIDYFSSNATWRYLIKNSIALFGMEHSLPGLFEYNPYPRAVNGSLWSLTYELKMYGILLLIFLIGRGLQIANFVNVFTLFFVIIGVSFYACAPTWLGSPLSTANKFTWLTPLFFIGSLLSIYKDRIYIKISLAFASIIFLLISSLISQSAFRLFYPFCLAYLAIFIAYRLNSPIFNIFRKFDYSYGIYIYSFIIQQIICDVLPGISATNLCLYSLALSTMFAAVSWHVIENPALQVVKNYTKYRLTSQIKNSKPIE